MGIPSMATDVPNELEAFRDFIDHELARGSDASVDELIEKYRQRRSELERLRQELKPALEQSQRGESQPLDAEALKKRVRDRLAEKGVTD